MTSVREQAEDCQVSRDGGLHDALGGMSSAGGRIDEVLVDRISMIVSNSPSLLSAMEFAFSTLQR